MSDETQLIVTGTTDLTVAEANALALAELFEEDAGLGLENITANDKRIPYLKLMQKGSPEVEEGNPAQIPGAVAGMLLNTVSKELYDIRSTQGKYALIVPVKYERVICEWRPNKGGKVGEVPFKPSILKNAIVQKDATGKTTLVNEVGNTLEETAKWHVLLLTADGKIFWGILALTSSKLGASGSWMNLVTSHKLKSGKDAPMPSHVYRVSSWLDKSKRTGDTFQNLRFENHGAVTDVAMYNAAKDYKRAVEAGEVEEAAENDSDHGANSTDEPAF